MANKGEAGHHIAVGAVAAVVASLRSQAVARVVGVVPCVVEPCRVSRGGISKGWVMWGGEGALVPQVRAFWRPAGPGGAVCGGRAWQLRPVLGHG
jgi:hypothetical protein